jgi:hypothetical protein
MTLTQCRLDDYPTVIRVSIDQPSTAIAGRVIVDCVTPAVQDNAPPLPKRTTLRLSARNFSGIWALVSVARPKPVPGQRGASRFVFADARYDLSIQTMKQSYNLRDGMGAIDPATEKTIQQLWDAIATQTGLSITTRSLPAFKPPASWEGRPASHCADDLLATTGCRMVYDPISAHYVVSAAGSGVLPSIAKRFFQRTGAAGFNKLVVQSAPTLYEGIVKAKASWLDDVGALVDLPTPIKYFLGYDDEANLRKRNRLIQSGFRIWKPVSVNHPSNLNWPDNFRLCNHRAVVVMGAPVRPVYQSIAIRNEAGHWNLSGDASGQVIAYRPDAGVITTHKPALSINDSGAMNTTMDFIAAYYVKDEEEFGGWKVKKKSIDLTATPGVDPVTKHLIVHHVRPTDSNRDDGPTAGQWQTLIDNIADANQPLMQGIAQTVTLPSLQRTSGSGRISRAKWHVSFSPRPQAYSELTLDEPPPGLVQHIGAQS